MPESTVIRVKRDAQWLIADAAAAHTYTIAYEPGDGSYTVPDAAITLILDRGEIGSVPSIRLGDESPMTGSLTAYLRDLGDTAGTYATLLDIIHRYAAKYAATNWISTIGAASDVPTVTIQLTIDGSPFGEADKTVTFAYCVLRGNVTEGDPSTIAMTWTSFSLRPTLS